MGWALTVLAAVSWALTAAVAFYMLRPVDYTGIGRLGWVGFLYPLQLAVATPVAAALAALAWRRGAGAAAGGFAVVAVLTSVLALWPTVSLWQRARQYHVPLSLGEALAVHPDWGEIAPDGHVGYATLGTGARLTLDLWRAETAAGATHVPVVLRVHGGAWIAGGPRSHSEWARWLTRLGYDVFDVEYRLPPHARWQDEVGDVKCALGWVITHAARYRIDPTRISVMGYSAGGNLALLAAYSMGDPRLPASCDVPTVAVRAAVNLYGPVDLTLLYRSSGSRAYIDRALEKYIGGTPSEFPRRYRAVSPISHIDAGTPPTITVLGESDRVVPVNQANELDKALADAGVPHASYLLPATDHGFDDNWGAFGTQIARVTIERFLRQYG
jgi:acetyl esterase/lipase